MDPKPEYLNEYIAVIIQTNGIEFVIANYIALREEYYMSVPPRY